MTRSRRTVLIVGIAYGIVGVLTARLALSAESTSMRTAWRLAAWLLSGALFALHLGYERLRVGGSPASTAARVAGAVALGAFVLAVAGPVRSSWGTERFRRAAALSMVVWPMITGVPAFMIALAAGSIHQQIVGRGTRDRGRSL
jgi:hypothetical protein